MIYNFDSSQTGAPVLSGTAGALRALLKACLMDGFGAGAVATLTVASGVATATYAGAHPFAPGCVAEISGATPAELNGKKIVTTTTGSSITFPAPGVPDGSATGTISSKAAAPGWLELFAGALTNVIALKPSVPEATGCELRVDDTGTTTARVLGYESLQDISTGVGRFPTTAQSASGLHWPKSSEATGAARDWRLYASERTVLLWLAPVAGAAHGVLLSFGDLKSYRSGDAYACVISGGVDASVSSTGAPVGACMGYGSAGNVSSNDFFVARAATALGGALAAKKVAAHNLGGGYSGTAAYNPNVYAYPSPVDYGLRVSPLEVVSSNALRGVVPGVLHTAQVLGDAFSTGDRIDGSGVFAGRTLQALRVGAPGGALASAGTVFIDLTGPWE